MFHRVDKTKFAAASSDSDHIAVQWVPIKPSWWTPKKLTQSLNSGRNYFRRPRTSTGQAAARLLPLGGSIISERIFSDPLSGQEGVQNERHGEGDPKNPQRYEARKNQCHDDKDHASRSVVVDTPPGSSYSRFLCFPEVIQHGAPKCISGIGSAYPALVMKRGYARGISGSLTGPDIAVLPGPRKVDIVSPRVVMAD